MNKLIITYIACTLSCVIHGQTVFNFSNPDFNSSHAILNVTADSSVTLTGLSGNDFMYGSVRVYQSTLTPSGSIEDTKALEGFSGEYGSELIGQGMNNGDMIIGAELTGCDYGLPMTVSVYDRNGIPHFTPITVDINTYPTPKVSLINGEYIGHDKAIAISDRNKTFVLSLDGTTSEMLSEVLAYDVQIELDSGYISATDSLIEFQDKQFNTIISKALAGHVISIDTMAEGSVVLTDSFMYILDDQFEVQDSVSKDPGYHSAIATSSDIWVIGENGYVARYTPGLTLDSIYTLAFPASILDIKHVGDIIHMAGLYTTDYESSRFHIRTDANAFLAGSPPDVSLVKIRVADTVRTRPTPWGPFHFLDIDYGSVYVTLMNEGSETISDVDIKMRQPHCPGICSGAYELSFTLDSLDLKSGEMREYYLNDLEFHCADFSPADLCMWVVAPNRQPDLDPVATPICAEINIVTGTNDADFRVDPDIRPNPSSGQFQITSDLTYVRYQIFNGLGQLVQYGSIDTDPFSVDLSAQANGTYILLLQSTDGNYASSKLILAR